MRAAFARYCAKGQPWSAKVGPTVLGVVGVLLVGSLCGCASRQLNHNASDLATSLNALTKRQIAYNLAQASGKGCNVTSAVNDNERRVYTEGDACQPKVRRFSSRQAGSGGELRNVVSVVR